MSDFDKNVFINCPFDNNYWALFRPLVYTVRKLGFVPRYSLERADSSEVRMGKIVGLIKDSKYGIHDLSRCIAQNKGEIYRLNMPLELGLDLGAKNFGRPSHRQKKVLVLEEERYRFQAAVSDLAGSDIKHHGAKPEKIMKCVRDWLVHEASAPSISPSQLWVQFNECMSLVYDELRSESYNDADIEHLPEHELIERMSLLIEPLQ